MARRRHSKRKRRRGSFGFLYKVLSMLVICGCLVAALFFRVNTIVVTGQERYTQDQIVEASGVGVGDNLFLLNKYAVAGNIRTALPYVDEIRINRKLPDTLLIEIKECGTPMAVVQDGFAWLVSPSGRIVEQLDTTQAEGYAVISGCQLLAPGPGHGVRLPAAEPAGFDGCAGGGGAQRAGTGHPPG